jgi:hypothetical protein
MTAAKRQRERKKAEKAALKRERRAQRAADPETGEGDRVATREDLEAYGLIEPDEAED